MLGIALSCATLMTTTTGLAGTAGPDGALCVPRADACRGAALPAPAPYDDGDYATPAEIVCLTISAAHTKQRAGSGDLAWLSGDCESTVLDLRYRVSRFPDSERPSGAFRSELARRSVRSASAATGLPPDTGALVLASVQPMALYASHDLIPPSARTMPPHAGTSVATRALDPPDRPPRV